MMISHLPDVSRIQEWPLYSLDMIQIWVNLYGNLTEKRLLNISQKFGVPGIISSGEMSEHLRKWVATHSWIFFLRFCIWIKAKRGNFGNLYFFCKSHIHVLHITNMILFSEDIKKCKLNYMYYLFWTPLLWLTNSFQQIRSTSTLLAPECEMSIKRESGYSWK